MKTTLFCGGFGPNFLGTPQERSDLLMIIPACLFIAASRP